MMNCQDCRTELSAVIALPEEQWSPELRQHLAECAACRQEFLWLQKVQAAIRADHPAELPPNLHRSIMAAIAGEKLTAAAAAKQTADSAKTRAVPVKRAKQHRRFWTAAAIAAIAAVAMLIQTSGLLVRPEQTVAEAGITDTAKEKGTAADTSAGTEPVEKTGQGINRPDQPGAALTVPMLPEVSEPPTGSGTTDSVTTDSVATDSVATDSVTTDSGTIDSVTIDSGTIGSKTIAAGEAAGSQIPAEPPRANPSDPLLASPAPLPPEANAAGPDSTVESTALSGIAAVTPADPLQAEPRSVQIQIDQALQELILTAVKDSALPFELIKATAAGSLTELKIEGTGEELVELLQGIVIPAGSTVLLPAFSLQPTQDSEKPADQSEVIVYPIGSRCVTLEAGTVYQLSFEFQVK
ncbi:MAG: hypothetical protein LLG09_01715 [Negativicutes bacterium]|nr:hypothetical protein [Negativicutes bacterium]